MTFKPQQGKQAAPGVAVNFNSYFLELERLLERLEQAATHYQVLGAEPSASREEIIAAYQQLLHQLFPSYQLAQTLPAELRQRMDQGFARAGQACLHLGDGRRRQEYDTSLQSQEAINKALSRLPVQPVPAAKPVISSPSPQPVPHPADSLKNPPPVSQPVKTPPPVPAVSRQTEAVLESKAFARNEVYTLYGTDQATNRRRCDRLNMSLPVRVTGHEKDGSKWHEMSESVDVSRTGIHLTLSRRVRHNTILHLTLPLPLKLRAHGFHEASYNVYAIVRRIFPLEKGARTVGLEFIGEHPPSGYLEKPWAVCRTRAWKGINRRRHKRVERAEEVTIEFLTDDRQIITRESGITENISRSGARVKVSALPREFDLARIIAPESGFNSVSVITNTYPGQDKGFRLCLQFIEREWPIGA